MHQVVSSLSRAVAGYNVTSELIIGLLEIFIISLLILSLGKYLWNKVLVKLVSVVKPVQSVWELLGLYFLILIFR